MKKTILILIVIAAISCRKEILHTDPQGESINAPVVQSSAVADRVYQLKYTGKYSDTSAVARNGGGIIIGGDSYHERWLYAIDAQGNSWQRQWQGLPVLNRAIGGTTWAEQLKYIDSLYTCYKPKVIVLNGGNNEYLRYIGTNPKTRDAARTVLPSFNRFYDTLRAHNPQAKIIIIGMLTCPKLYVRGYNGDIANVTNKYPVGYPTASSLSLQQKAIRDANSIYVEYRSLFPVGSMTKYEKDSIHPKLTSYTEITAVVRPKVDSLFKTP
jgi:hypothetical protein